MTRPFRFGVQLNALPAADWRQRLRRIEALGFSSVFWPDHFSPQWEPVAALAAAAAVTERVHVGSLVYDVDYRHPVILAKASATIHLLSGGRHEFGIGAGWMKSDYREAGMPYDRPGVRIERMDEALTIIRSMWTEKKTSFEGRHYRIEAIAQAAPLGEGERPAILIGGGGPKILGVAGRHVDIVGINPKIPEGEVLPHHAAELSPEKLREKIGWLQAGAEAAGRDLDEIELNSLSFVTVVTDDPKPIRELIAKNTSLSVEEVASSAAFLTGSASEIRERLEAQREDLGISYIVIQGERPDVLEAFAEGVVAPLDGK